MKCDLCMTERRTKRPKFLNNKMQETKCKTTKKFLNRKISGKNICRPNDLFIHLENMYSLYKLLVLQILLNIFYGHLPYDWINDLTSFDFVVYLCSACLNTCLNELNYYREKYTQFSVQNSFLRRHEIKVV